MPDKTPNRKLLRIVLLRRGSIPCAAIFDEAGLYPTRQTERILDTCFSDALSAQYAPRTAEASPLTQGYPPIHRIRTETLTAAYLARYAVGMLSAADGVPFSFSCGSTPSDRLLARLLCAMGAQESVAAPIHFAIREVYADNGDILCPLSVTDLRQLRAHGQPVSHSHWELLSALIEQYRTSHPTANFPTPRISDAAAERQPLSIPVCAPLELHAELRYSHAPTLSENASENDPARLSRRYAAMEAEDAVLLARGIAQLLSEQSRALTPPDSAGEGIAAHPLCRYHGLAVSAPDPLRPLTLTANLSRLTKGGSSAVFRPAVEGILHQSDRGSVRIVATRDHNFRIIADAHSAEAAEALFSFAKDRLLQSVRSASKP